MHDVSYVLVWCGSFVRLNKYKYALSAFRFGLSDKDSWHSSSRPGIESVVEHHAACFILYTLLLYINKFKNIHPSQKE
ncbi:hypothetical protein Plhal304r1_c004g0018621 [Plasmopara halstedii]